MNKKGQFSAARKAVFWTVILVIITMIVLFFFFIIANYKNRLTEVPAELQAELIALRFANIPECFAYETSGKVLHNVVDLDKFTNERMNKCYSTVEIGSFKTFNFKLRLLESGEEIITDKYYHNDRPDFTINKEVLLKKSNGEPLKKDLLKIFIQEKIGK